MAEPKEVMNSPAVQKYLAAIDDATNDGLKEHKSTLSSMGSDYPSNYTNEYKKDARALEDAQGDFNAAANALTLGKVKDAKKAIAAYNKFVLTLGVLEEQNIRFGAYIESDFAQQCLTLIAVSIAVLEKARKDFESLQKKLLDLQAMIKQAEKQVTQAEVQMALNLLLDGISLILPEFRLATSLGAAAAQLAASVLIDAALGPGKPSAEGVVNTMLGDVTTVQKAMPSKLAKVTSGATAVVTLKMDIDEVLQAAKLVEKIQDAAARLDADIRALNAFLGNDADKISKAGEAYRDALDATKKAAGKYQSAESRRLQLVRELQKI
jgi:hypothetical protein